MRKYAGTVFGSKGQLLDVRIKCTQCTRIVHAARDIAADPVGIAIISVLLAVDISAGGGGQPALVDHPAKAVLAHILVSGVGAASAEIVSHLRVSLWAVALDNSTLSLACYCTDRYPA